MQIVALLFRFLFVFPVVILLAACGQDDRISPSAQDYRITEVEIVYTVGGPISWPEKADQYARRATGLSGPAANPTGGEGNPQFDDNDPYLAAFSSQESMEYQRQAFVQRARTDLPALATPLLRGQKPAKLRVEVQSVSVTHAFMRSMAGGDSHMSAQLTLIDKANGAVIDARRIFVIERAAQVSGNIGIFIGFAFNTLDALANDQFEQLYEKFKTELGNWLTK